MSNVLFFPIWTVSPHLETDLELMQKEIDRGNKVFMLDCKRDLSICDNNLESKPERCTECIAVRRRALRLFKSVKIVPLKDYFEQRELIPQSSERLESVEDLNRLRFEDFDVGYSIGASLAQYLDELPFQDCKSMVLSFYSVAVGFYLAVDQAIIAHHIDYGYVFNGRFSLSRAFFRAFQKHNLPVYTHDRGSSYKKYTIYDNVLPHDIDDYAKRVNSFWEDGRDSRLKESRSAEYFQNRLRGKETEFTSFTAQQTAKKLPENYLAFKKRIAIFNSSTFEYDYIGPEYGYKFYKSQSDGIRRICEAFSGDSTVGIFLREHPNLQGRKSKQRKEVREIQHSNFFVIPAESDISSYDMLLRADVVVTFTSTVGIEATFWGIPSVLCSNAIYQKLHIAYQPESHLELIEMLRSNLQPINRSDALKYGYYHGYSGIEYKYYEPTSLFGGTFKGKNIYVSTIDHASEMAVAAGKRVLKRLLGRS
jgi:hypothetical protein